MNSRFSDLITFGVCSITALLESLAFQGIPSRRHGEGVVMHFHAILLFWPLVSYLFTAMMGKHNITSTFYWIIAYERQVFLEYGTVEKLTPIVILLY